MNSGSPADSFRDDVVRVAVSLIGVALLMSLGFWANVEGVVGDSAFNAAMVVFDVVLILGFCWLGLRYRKERDAR